MKNIFIISFLFTVNLFSVRADKPFLIRTFPASSITAVEVSTIGGDITINGDAGSEAVVEVYISRNKYLSDEQIKQAIEEHYNINIYVENEKLYAMIEMKTNRGTQFDVSFKINVPKHIISDLTSMGGDILLNNLSGSLHFRTMSGSLTIENVSGIISGSTLSGNITVTNSKDDIVLSALSGNITAKDCDGNIILNTLDGSINVKMKSVNEYVKLSTTGDISLSLPAEKGYSIKAYANKIETSGFKDFSGKMDKNSIEGILGNGNAVIEINNEQLVNNKVRVFNNEGQEEKFVSQGKLSLIIE